MRAAFWYKDARRFIDRTLTNSGKLGIATGPVVGTVRNVADEHTWGMRATGLFQPNDQLKISAMIYLERQHFDAFNDITGGPGNPGDPGAEFHLGHARAPGQHVRHVQRDDQIPFRALQFPLLDQRQPAGRDHSEEGTSLVQYIPAFFGQPPYAGALANVGVTTFRLQLLAGGAAGDAESIAGFDGVLGAYFSEAHDPTSYAYYPANYNALVTGNDPANPAYAPDGGTCTPTGVPAIRASTRGVRRDHLPFHRRAQPDGRHASL